MVINKRMAKVEFLIPSVLNKGTGEKKISLEANDLEDAFAKISDQMGEDFKRRVFDVNGKPRSLINIYINGKNMRFSSDWYGNAAYRRRLCLYITGSSRRGRAERVKICNATPDR